MSTNERIDRLRQRGLLPYQAQFVDAMLTGPAKRVVLSAPFGVGKGAAAAALVAEAFAASPETRCLVLCPAALVMQWQDLLTDRLPASPRVMTAGLYRRLQEEDTTQPNPWRNHSTFVASYDFAKSSDRMESLLRAGWTIAICDEIHYCVGQRAKLVGRLWLDDSIPLCLGITATPQKIDAEMAAGTTGVVWDASVLKDWDGKPLFRPRRTIAISFQRTREEKEFRSALFEAMSRMREPRDNLARQLVLARANSSLYAIEQTLRRLLAQSTDLAMLLTQEKDDSAEPLSRGVSDLIGTDVMRACLEMLERIPKDTKLAAALGLISNMRQNEPSNIIVFTQFKDTAYYVSSSLAEEGVTVECLTGADSSTERSEKLDRAKQQPCVLVCTDAMAEGVDPSFSHRVVHYDIPWNTTTIEQRFGRVVRLTQGREIEIATLMCEDADDPESEVVRRLAQRLEEIRTALGGDV